MKLPPVPGRRAAVRALVLVAFAGLLAAGSGAFTGDAGAGRVASEKKQVVWLFYGPKNDGGYNTSQWNPAQRLIKARFGNQVEQVETDNVPYSAEASQITEQYIARGADLIFDTVAAGPLVTDVCGKYDGKVGCVEPNPAGPYPAAASALPKNVSSIMHEFWNQEYVLGVVAGMMTKSNVIGFVAPYKTSAPLSSANAFALGCQSVNAKCRLRMIVINNYFDPPRATQAANSLVNAGADVLHGWTDDPAFCVVAEKRKVRAIAQFFDYRNVCPNAFVSSALWNFQKAFVREVELLVKGQWKGQRSTWMKLGEGADIAPWGKNVPARAKAAAKKLIADIRGGKNVFVGPIYDAGGKLRVKKGEKLGGDYLYRKWTWPIRGVVGS